MGTNMMGFNNRNSTSEYKEGNDSHESNKDEYSLNTIHLYVYTQTDSSMSTFKYRLANPLTPTIDYKNVSETGCNGNFIPSNAPYINKQRTENPIGVKQPSGPPMQLSHEAKLGVNIPPKACDYHILTRLTKDSQLYIDKF